MNTAKVDIVLVEDNPDVASDESMAGCKGNRLLSNIKYCSFFLSAFHVRLSRQHFWCLI